MKSVVVRSHGGPEVLELVDVLEGEVGQGQIRIGVHASSIGWIDVSARTGRLVDSGLLAPATQVGLGWDVAGTVSEVGPGVARFTVGEPVIGLRDLLFAPGAHAESVVLDASAVATAPRSVSLVEAATLPLNGLTAIQSVDLTSLRRGETLLVTGAAGGVGGFVLEIARLRGIRTVALARQSDADLVRGFGAAHVVTEADALGSAVRRLIPGGVDAVIDAANLGITAHNALRSNGIFVALVRPFAPPPIRGTTVVVQEVWADGDRLAELAGLVDAHELTLRVARTFPLADAAEAYTIFEAGGTRGRIVLQS